MAPQERSLPLFPLNMVLFPNASLPLQIFEERYKLMMQHCLDGDSQFGVVLIKSGSEVGEAAVPYSTGTLAQIVQVNRVKGGRMFISVTGRQRFQIQDITQHQPYMAALVELLDDDVEASVPVEQMESVRQAVSRHISLTLGLSGGWVRETRLPDDPAALSYLIAGALQLGFPEKQALLEEPSVSKRLVAELTILEREAEGLKRTVGRQLRQRFSRQ